ncbi:uncharacterized protein LOC129593172 [Paramacrobiotus metropolitanus]|uniref:uncharacterized protein LOC129593172 n=1 Tax=Paramacrobiotus metropolitanus TaxID=2943436 RepID=UPI00244617F3|nr:uncharacterized protein LOC129593172 [Paramacrobiotus metropolitanus]XP_055345364.1 uncharacterized protein LOC129593172 [Paramacrobiotus metropolitanus]
MVEGQRSGSALYSPAYWKKHAIPEESFYIPPRLAEYIEDLLIAVIENQPKDYQLCEFCMKFFHDKMEAEVASNRDTIAPDPEKYHENASAADMLKKREIELHTNPATIRAGQAIVATVEKDAIQQLKRSTELSAGQRNLFEEENAAKEALKQQRQVSWDSSGKVDDLPLMDGNIGIKRIQSIPAPENVKERLKLSKDNAQI